jgi:hypothetical protein
MTKLMIRKTLDLAKVLLPPRLSRCLSLWRTIFSALPGMRNKGLVLIIDAFLLSIHGLYPSLLMDAIGP